MNRAKLVTLLITRECNLRCKYCYVHSYDGGLMSLEIAKASITDAFGSAVNNFARIEFAFLGGEPFCAFDRLREICEWTWAQQWPLPYLFSASTNGTKCTEEVRQWLVDNHERFYLSLSYDGMIDAQDKNRCNSGSKIDLPFFHQYWPDVPVKMTITEDNVSRIYDNIQLLNNIGVQVNDTFADGVPAWQESSLRILDKQLQLLCDSQLKNPQPHPSDLLSVDVTRILFWQKRNLFFCDAGKTRVTYDYDGTPYICHLLSPLALNESQLSELPRALSKSRKEDDKCLGCALDSVCPSCEGNNYRMSGDCWTREEKTCNLFRHQLYFACVYQMKQILHKHELTDDDKLKYKAIVQIMKSEPMKEIIKNIHSNLHRLER